VREGQTAHYSDLVNLRNPSLETGMQPHLGFEALLSRRGLGDRVSKDRDGLPLGIVPHWSGRHCRFLRNAA
jgi:hypothetical protein